jgi:hypothetical protein
MDAGNKGKPPAGRPAAASSSGISCYVACCKTPAAVDSYASKLPCSGCCLRCKHCQPSWCMQTGAAAEACIVCG